MSTNVNLATWCEVAHRKIIGAILPYKSGLRKSQLGSHLLHYSIFRERRSLT